MGEAHACIDAHITDPDENAQAHDMVDKGFDHVDKNGDGEIDEHELSKAMRAHKLAQKMLAKKGPSAKDIIDACDGNGSGGIDLEEAHACIDAHITDPDQNAQAHEMVDEGFEEGDKNGDNELTKKEVKACIKKHVPPEAR